MNIIKVLLTVAFLCSLINCGGSPTKESQNNNTPKVETNPVEETLYPDYNTNPIPADNTGMTSTAVEIASRIKLGWNIGNTMEATGGKSETYWGNPLITDGLIRLVKDHGFDAVRIPVSWDQYANQETAEIDAAWLYRVKEVVQYCMENDIYVLINIHWDGGWLEETTYGIVRSLAKKLPTIQDDGHSVEIERLINGQKVLNELDVVVLVNNKLFVIECKTKQFHKGDGKITTPIFSLSAILSIRP